MAAYNMKQALKIMEELPKENPEVYKRLATKNFPFPKLKKRVRIVYISYISLTNEDDIIPQSDQFLSLKKLDLTKYKKSKRF